MATPSPHHLTPEATPTPATDRSRKYPIAAPIERQRKALEVEEQADRQFFLTLMNPTHHSYSY